MDPPPTWPTTGRVVVPWSPTIPDDLVPRVVRARHRGPYRAALVPAIAAAVPRLRAETTAIADDASRAVARFDVDVGHDLAGLDAVLLRSESASSSQVEHLPARARAIALAEIGVEGNPATSNAALIAANGAAMRLDLERAASLDEASVLGVHDALLRAHAPGIAGRWRTDLPVLVHAAVAHAHVETIHPPTATGGPCSRRCCARAG